MLKKVFLLTIVLFFSARFAYAEVVINEVQVKPVGESFIELHNIDASQDLTGWSLKRKTASGTEYPLVSASRLEGKSISAGDYFLLANENYAGGSAPDITWAKSYNLANDNSVLLYDANGTLVDEVGWGDASGCGSSCPSNPEEGKSIQKTSAGSWNMAAPTPNEENEATSVSLTSNDINEEESEDNSAESKPKISEPLTIKAKILVNTLAFAGQPLEIKTNVFGYSNENVVLGRAYWNFGDGESFEQVNNFEKFYHTYYYPGEYALFLEYYQKKSSQTPDATSKVTIKVLPVTVTISRVGDAKDFFVELSNNANSDIDISNWVISANGKIFTLPRNSIIMSKKMMTISSKITGFKYGDQYNLKLSSSTGELVFDYPASVLPPVKIAIQPKVPYVAVQPSIKSISVPEEVSVENLLASAVSGEGEIAKNNPIRAYFFTIILTVFLGVGAIAVYFIRQKRVVLETGNDFKILDE
ncbi:MAG: lamin tail domain-containing protein [Candidatus Paceibacterota bacterium]|jgi:hypothetical protein